MSNTITDSQSAVESKKRKKGIPEGLWLRCPGCNEAIFRKEMMRRMNTCPECDHHFYVSAKDRVEQVLDRYTDDWTTAQVNALPVAQAVGAEGRFLTDFGPVAAGLKDSSGDMSQALAFASLVSAVALHEPPLAIHERVVGHVALL